jgi:hypothetical protein
MKVRGVDWLGRLDARVLAGLLGLGLLFVALEAWLLVLRAPVAEWRVLAATRPADDAVAPRGLAEELERLGRAIDDAERELRAGAPGADDDATVLHLIATLDGVAARSGVALGSVRPAGRRVERDVEHIGFDVEARGTYRQLVDWLALAEREVAPLRVTELALTTADEGRQVALKVKFAAFVPILRGGTSP